MEVEQFQGASWDNLAIEEKWLAVELRNSLVDESGHGTVPTVNEQQWTYREYANSHY